MRKEIRLTWIQRFHCSIVDETTGLHRFTDLLGEVRYTKLLVMRPSSHHDTAFIRSLTTGLHDLQSTAPSQPSFHIKSYCQLSAREAQKSTTFTKSHTSWPSLSAHIIPPLQKQPLLLCQYTVSRSGKQKSLVWVRICDANKLQKFFPRCFTRRICPNEKKKSRLLHYRLVLLSVARLSLAVTCRSKAYSPLQTSLRYTSYTGATVDVR